MYARVLTTTYIGHIQFSAEKGRKRVIGYIMYRCTYFCLKHSEKDTVTDIYYNIIIVYADIDIYRMNIVKYKLSILLVQISEPILYLLQVNFIRLLRFRYLY